MNFNQILLGSFLLFLSLNVSAQSDLNQFLLDTPLQENNAWIYNNNSSNSSSSFEEDLLIARRNDVIENGEFVFQDSIQYQNDENGNLTNVLTLAWDGQIWNNASMTNATHDANENLTLLLSQRWIDGEWVNSYEYIFEYDDDNNRIFRSIKGWVDDEWSNVVQIFDSYNQDNQLIESRQQRYSTEEWVNSSRSLYTYNNEGNRSELNTEFWIDGQWFPSSQTSYLYDENENLIEDDKRRWVMGILEPNNRNIYEYDDQQNQISSTEQNPIDNEYKNASRRESEYNNDNLLTRQTAAIWEESAWVYTSSVDLIYDERENRSYTLSQNWSTDLSDWEVASQSYYYYLFESPVKDIATKQIDFNISPNPSKGLFEINFSQNLSEEIKINIYSLEGKLIEQLEANRNSEKTSLNLSHLANGTYFLSATSATGTGSQKIFIER